MRPSMPGLALAFPSTLPIHGANCINSNSIPNTNTWDDAALNQSAARFLPLEAPGLLIRLGRMGTSLTSRRPLGSCPGPQMRRGGEAGSVRHVSSATSPNHTAGCHAERAAERCREPSRQLVGGLGVGDVQCCDELGLITLGAQL